VQKVLLLMTLLGFLACSRSMGLSSDQVDCMPGEHVFSRNAMHCAYFANEAPATDECPEGAENRYAVGNIVICSSADDLTPAWIFAITNAAWPIDAGVPDAGLADQSEPFDGTNPDAFIDASGLVPSSDTLDMNPQ